MEAPQFLQETCSSRQPLAHSKMHTQKSVSSCPSENSCVLIWAHCLLSCKWTSLKRVCLTSLFFFYQVLMHMKKMSLTLLFSKLSSISFGISSYERCSRNLIISLWVTMTFPGHGHNSMCPCPSRTVEPKFKSSTPDKASSGKRKEQGSSPCWQQSS